jgi:hypothetical protein
VIGLIRLAAKQIEIELLEFEQVFYIEAGSGGHCAGLVS